MYFRKTVHCWCVGSSWIDLPVRVIIICLYTLEMTQAILKFKKVSDILIVIAGLEFICVTQYSLHFANVVSAVQNHHTVALVGFTYDDLAVFAQCEQRTAFVFRYRTGVPLALVKKCGHIAPIQRHEFLLQNQQISCDKKSNQQLVAISEVKLRCCLGRSNLHNARLFDIKLLSIFLLNVLRITFLPGSYSLNSAGLTCRMRAACTLFAGFC